MQWVVHFSTDVVFLWSGGTEERIPYSDLERALPSALVARVNQYKISQIVTINGPGGFTALRIGSLALQTLKEFGKNPITLYSISKLDLFALLCEQDFLPSLWVIHIGQKKKLWRVDRSRSAGGDSSAAQSSPHISVYTKTELDNIDDEEYFIDMIDQHILLEDLDILRMVSFASHVDGLEVNFREETLLLDYKTLQSWGPVAILQPNYMIDPTLS